MENFGNEDLEEMDDDNCDIFDFEEEPFTESRHQLNSTQSTKLVAEGSSVECPGYSCKPLVRKRYRCKTIAHRISDDYAKFPEYIKRKEDMGIEDVIKEYALPFLPAKSLCRFKTVCKEWDQWITNPFLAHKQSIHFRDMSGLFYQFPGCRPSFISLNRDAYGIPSPSLHFFPELVDVRTTCRGLLCCQSRVNDNAYFICNPVTKEWTALPKPELYHGCEASVALVFEPSALNFAADYELVCAVTITDHPVVYFEIYSSRTKSWRISHTICCELDGVKLNSDGFYMSGNVFWESLSGVVLAFDLKNEEYGILPLPSSSGPNGVLTEMHGELSYILPREQNDAYMVDVYGTMDMSLKYTIPLSPRFQATVFGVCRALTCVNDDMLILLFGRTVIAYHVRAQMAEWLSKVHSEEYARFFPYVNSLVLMGD